MTPLRMVLGVVAGVAFLLWATIADCDYAKVPTGGTVMSKGIVNSHLTVDVSACDQSGACAEVRWLVTHADYNRAKIGGWLGESPARLVTSTDERVERGQIYPVALTVMLAAISMLALTFVAPWLLRRWRSRVRLPRARVVPR